MRFTRRIAAVLLSAFAASASAQANVKIPRSPVTRLQVINGLLSERYRFFEQNLIVDGCALAKPVWWDSVSTSMGSLDERFAGAVRGSPGQCYRQDSTGTLTPFTAYLLSMSWRSEELPNLQPPEVHALVVAIRVKNLRTGAFRNEEWVLHLYRTGTFRAVSMRVTHAGTDD